MSPALALLCALLHGVIESALIDNERSFKALESPALGDGCLYEGEWYRSGATIGTGEACLRCACARGALSCRRRACAALPEPPPRRCHLLHRRGSCCAELHCPDGVITMEHGASARLEDEDISGPTSLAHACVEGGSVFAAGSALRSSVACEQCFCLGGTRRCVRPRCLPPPPGCRARPAPGACCPQRYYCEHRTKPPKERHPHDCKVDGKWVTEGERVTSPAGNCTQCFCLRGAVQCQPLACAPPLLGCAPLLRPGECCAHQYQCDRRQGSSESRILTSASALQTKARHNNNKPKPDNLDTTLKTTLASVYNLKNTYTTATKNHLISTTKVKRKTSDPPPAETSSTASQNITTSSTTTTTTTTTTTKKPTTVAKLIATTEEASTTELTTEAASTDQPEGSVRIMINGTINCTAELSSTSLPLNITVNDTERINMESMPRVPIIDVSSLEDHTFSPNDIITDRTVNGDFDDNESFVINVTSSLMTKTNKTLVKPPTVLKVSPPTDLAEALNSSKKTKGDYDFDYSQPTLPPSLPNLKIIPFVAADAVIDDDNSKETLTYPMLEREDKFPVYYPTADTKDIAYATRREDSYHSTQYPVFITDKDQEYPSLVQDVDLTSKGYSNMQPELGTAVNEYTVSASLGNHVAEPVKPVTQQPITSTTFKLETPAVNLFSPPVETEGGFVPKGPGIIDEYFAVFPSTPSGPAVPHMTTSMQLDMAKGECTTSDGRRIPEGDTISLACSACACAWGELHCTPRACRTPPRCSRRPPAASTSDICCGDLVCEEDYETTQAPELSTKRQKVTETPTTKNNLVPSHTASQNSSKPSPPVEYKVDVPIKNVVNISEVSGPSKISIDSARNATVSPPTERPTTKKPIATTTQPVQREPERSQNSSQEYEDEDDDEGFSFGNVLKLLLSDNYDTTTAAPKKPTTPRPAPTKPSTTTRRPRPPPASFKPTVAPFVPLPAYIPPKISQNPINRIDHLVLGESTAIKKTTPRPATYRPPARVTRPEVVKETHTTQEAPRNPPGGLPGVPPGVPPGAPPGVGAGLLKLAGCNIYGRMYRVGRIIAELSTPCQECWCTEFGVQCKQLKC